MAKIIVTGGAGFIGSHVVDDLISRGHDVTVIDNFSSGDLKNLDKKVKYYKFSILNHEHLNYVFELEKPDYVYHFAAQVNLRNSVKNPIFDCQENILGSVKVIDVSARFKVKKFIFSSTGGAIYSEIASLPWNETSKTLPASPYGLSKLTVEKYLDLYQTYYGMPYVSLRYSNVFGPRQNAKGEAGVVSIFIDKIKNGEDLVIFGDGNQTRDYVYVKDVVHANIMALSDNLRGIFNVSSGIATSVNDLAKIVIKSIDTDVRIHHVSPPAGEIRHSVLDSSKLQKFGWEPRIKLAKGIRKTIKSWA